MKTLQNFSNRLKLMSFAFFATVFSACGTNSTKNTTMETNVNASDSFLHSSSQPIGEGLDTITLGGGCYWCVEAVYELLDGVVKVESGFSGGFVKNPSYREVCNGTTGHAEVVQITFDRSKTSIDEILKVFFTVHDPTTLNRQGADIGTQYRSGIYYRNDEQKNAALSIIQALNKENVYGKPVVTEVKPFDVFYKAEEYHQNYYNQNKSQPYCQMVIQPKIEKFEKLFKDRIKK